MMARGSMMWLVLAAAAALALPACGGASRDAETAKPVAATSQDPSASGAAGGSSVTLSPVPAHAPATGDMGGGASTGALDWKVPEGWIEEPPKSAMRKAQYRLPASSGDGEDGECVVYYFGAGQGGDTRANLDRWAAQFSGPGSTSPKFSQSQVGGLTVSRAEVKGTYMPSPMSMGGGPEPQPKPNAMLLGAIVPGPDANWFFKCTGPEKTMEAHRERFDALIASVHPAPQ